MSMQGRATVLSPRAPDGIAGWKAWVGLAFSVAIFVLCVVSCALLLTPSFRHAHPECGVFLGQNPPPALRHCLSGQALFAPSFDQLMDPMIDVLCLVAVAIGGSVLFAGARYWASRDRT